MKKDENEEIKEVSKKTFKKKVIMISIIAIICIIAIIVTVYIVNNIWNSTNVDIEKSNSEEVNGFKQTTANVSFANMNIDDENLDEVQKDIINYFDDNYFEFSSKDAQKYPQVFQGAKVCIPVAVIKVLKSTNDEFEVLAVDCGITMYNYYEDTKIEDIPVERLLVISGKQLNERLSKNDMLYVLGRYIDVENKEIDGKTYMVSKIQANNVVKIEQNYENVGGVSVYSPNVIQIYSFSTLKNIAEYIFGKDIKVNEAVKGQDYDSNDFGDFYKITLDNQSNANFKVFNMYKNTGMITYNKIHNELSDNIQKRLFISADFQHFIVSTYDKGTKHVYIDYFDKQLNKIWGREFDYSSTKSFVSPIDYDTKKLAIVVDNDLYLLDLETGENIIEPVIVGEKIKVNMMSDGIILIGDNNKDTIMKVDYSGNIIFRLNADTSMNLINSAELQIVNGKIVLKISGEKNTGSDLTEYLLKYIVLNSNGEIETLSGDLSDESAY